MYSLRIEPTSGFDRHFVLATVLALGLCSLRALAFNIELEKTDYLPGEEMTITCIWPEEPQENASLVTFVPYKDSLLGKPRQRYVPSTYFHYNSRYRESRCVELRAPWAPGEYTLEVTVKSTPPTPPIKKTITVGDLPEDDILEYVGITIRDQTGGASDGEYFEYNLTLASDRCYPDLNYWSEEKRDVLVFLVERETREIRSVDRFLMRYENQCIANCEPPVIKHICRQAGTYKHFLRIPRFAGQWDLTIAQEVASYASCADRCVKIPEVNDPKSMKYYQVLDQVPTVAPVAVKRIFATRFGDEPLDLSKRLDQSYYLWVEFESDNPFQSEKLSVELVGEEGEIESIPVHRQESYRLFKSKSLSGKYFRVDSTPPR